MEEMVSRCGTGSLMKIIVWDRSVYGSERTRILCHSGSVCG
jgi:hypothetical protein